MKLIEEDVALKQQMCAEDLEKAEPALVAAQAALDTLNKVNSFRPKIIIKYSRNETCVDKFFLLVDIRVCTEN